MISVITPTYNRGYILTRLFKSLKAQTMNNFEWIIVDDGSVDNTNQLVDEWKKDNDLHFVIHYIKKNNGGKHRALNVGIKAANFDFIFIVDSDDYLIDNAIKYVNANIVGIAGIDKFAGVSGLKASILNNEITILGDFPENESYVDATNLERRKYKLNGDKAEVYKKNLLLKYPFPEFENEFFIGEDAVWNQIASEGYTIRWFNQVLCICEYLEDGLTNQGSRSRNSNNFKGYTFTENLKIHNEKFPYNVLAVGRYIKLAKQLGLKNYDIKENLNINNTMLLYGYLFKNIRDAIKNVF